MSYVLVDPPVTPLSAPADIRAWLDALRAMEQTPEVIEEIAMVEDMLRRTAAAD